MDEIKSVGEQKASVIVEIATRIDESSKSVEGNIEEGNLKVTLENLNAILADIGLLSNAVEDLKKMLD
jgi:hypothetical protein